MGFSPSRFVGLKPILQLVKVVFSLCLSEGRGGRRSHALRKLRDVPPLRALSLTEKGCTAEQNRNAIITNTRSNSAQARRRQGRIHSEERNNLLGEPGAFRMRSAAALGLQKRRGIGLSRCLAEPRSLTSERSDALLEGIAAHDISAGLAAQRAQTP